MEKKVLKTDDYKIRNTLQREYAFADRFQPFLNEFLVNDYDIKPEIKWQTIRDMINTCALDKFMREQALIKSPYFQTMPVKKEKQLELVDVDFIYPNYSTLKFLFASIQNLPFQIRSKINSFYLNESNQLALSDTFIQKIKAENTIFGNDKQYEIFNSLTSLLDTAKQIQKESGISIFSSGMVINSEFGNLINAEINALRFVSKEVSGQII